MKYTAWLGASLILFGALTASPVYAQAPKQAPASVEDTLDRLRQIIVDLETSLRNHTNRGDAQLAAKIKDLQEAVGALKRTSIASDSRVESRLTNMERTIGELRTRLTRVEGTRGDVSGQVSRELTDLRSDISRIATELARLQPQARTGNDEMLCEFAKEHDRNLNTYPTGTRKVDKSVVRSGRKDNLVDALEDACKKCDPREFKGTHGYYDITKCMLNGCYFVKNGESVAPWERMVRLAPEKCRTVPPERQPPPPRHYACTVTFTSSGASSSVSSIPRDSRPLQAVSETLAGAVQAACNACAAHANERVRSTFIPEIATWACRDLACKTTDNNTAVLIPQQTVPRGCLFSRSR